MNKPIIIVLIIMFAFLFYYLWTRDSSFSDYHIFEDNSLCMKEYYQRGECSKGDLFIEVIKEGEGEGVKEGNIVEVHYEGFLLNGEKFDSSIERGNTFSFKAGEGRVISGWEQGVLGMKVGEERELRISPNLGYGREGAGDVIPPNSTLIFIIKLISIK